MQDVDGTNPTNFISPSGCSNTRLAAIDSALLAWVTGDLPNTRCWIHVLTFFPWEEMCLLEICLLRRGKTVIWRGFSSHESCTNEWV